MSAAVDVLASNLKAILASCEGASAYLSELAADIAANGGITDGETVEQAMIEAHSRRQSFAMEMHLGNTNRAARARKILSVQIYGEALVNAEIDAMQASDRHAENLRIWTDFPAVARIGGAA
ncbi:hypothetical protein Xmar_07920 [Xanthomonas axonopodis pv. martyniicola]|uniref:hypothetical protein n=1 Tax=Xanthomonas axonopodis TaxID=53413 RepID=UPI00099813A3|nr:hypothetical protein [Xanthomonas axonopodis]OOW67126.1 hypothetical protein Xmar_07920 [Xanthomonas axonopodis pv. martyniicola]OOW90121.1 hypothetical protein Xvtr_18915 [Xanthomonas campestris pv. vitiscarnosae]